VEANATYRSS
jgi:hypothetical protein